MFYGRVQLQAVQCAVAMAACVWWYGLLSCMLCAATVCEWFIDALELDGVKTFDWQIIEQSVSVAAVTLKPA
jgi:hypothetical protein